MWFESLDRYNQNNSPLHRLDPRIKLLGSLVFVFLVVATPYGWWRVLGAYGLVLAFLIGLSGIPPRVLVVRWLSFLMLVGFLAAMVAPSLPARHQFGLGGVILSIVIKNSLAFLMMLLLACVTPLRTLLRALRQLGVPLVLVATLQFMERYLHVLFDELDRMMAARRARSFHRWGFLSWQLLTSMVAMLLLRTFERSERVHAAMIARGWDGTLRSLDD